MQKKTVRRRKGSRLLRPDLERIAEQDPNESESLSSGNLSGSPLTLESFGSPNLSGADSSSDYSTSTSDEFEQVAAEIAAENESASQDVVSQDEPATQDSDGGELVKLPVLSRDDIETGLRFGHSQAVRAGWGEHWKLKDWQAQMLVPALDNWLQRAQATAESYIGTFLTRFAGEHKELCALLAVAAIVYVPNVRKTVALRADPDSQAGTDPATSITE